MTTLVNLKRIPRVSFLYHVRSIFGSAENERKKQQQQKTVVTVKQFWNSKIEIADLYFDSNPIVDGEKKIPTHHPMKIILKHRHQNLWLMIFCTQWLESDGWRFGVWNYYQNLNLSSLKTWNQFKRICFFFFFLLNIIRVHASFMNFFAWYFWIIFNVNKFWFSLAFRQSYLRMIFVDHKKSTSVMHGYTCFLTYLTSPYRNNYCSIT